MDYQKQAEDFLKEVGATINVVFLKHDKHFIDDKDARDIYEVTISKDDRKYTFNFGNSINSSGEYIVAPQLVKSVWNEKLTGGKYALTAEEYKKVRFTGGRDIYKNRNYKIPSAYDVLTCLQKYDPGTFENFCGDFGYDTDSKKAETTYKAICDEYKNVQILFSNSQIEKLQEIQ